MGLPENVTERDLSLVERFRRGEREAFDRIVAAYRGDIYRVARRMTGNHEDADDVSQETFLRAYKGLSGFRGDASLKTWLFRIALNLAINVGRTKATRRESDEDPEIASDAQHHAPSESEARLERRQEETRVRRAVDRLPPRQRQVVILRIYEELKFHEIADFLEAPIGTVKANFFHAMNNLRKTLA